MFRDECFFKDMLFFHIISLNIRLNFIKRVFVLLTVELSLILHCFFFNTLFSFFNSRMN